MRRRLVHVLCTLTVFAVAWLVGARPAMAATSSAPQCDHRAATTFAPPPQVQPLEMTLDIVLDESDCTPSVLASREVSPDRAPPSIDFTSQEANGSGASTHVVRAAVIVRVAAPAAAARAERRGVSRGLERPPRA